MKTKILLTGNQDTILDDFFFVIQKTVSFAFQHHFVFLTGITDKNKIKGVLAMQPQGYLLKPVDYERLHQTIEGILY